MLAAFWLLAGSAAAYEPPPIEAFAMRPITGEADLSPDGAHLAIRRLLGRGQHYAVFVYRTDDLQAKPYTIGSEHMDIMRVRWANDERLLLTVRQPVEIPGRRAGYASTSIGAPGRVKTYAYKLLSVGLEGGKFVELPRKGGIARSLTETFTNRLASPRVVDRLAGEDDWILVEWASDFADRSDLLRVNVHDGRMEPVFRQSENYFGYDLDGDKQVRLRSKIDRGEDTITVQYRLAGESEWRDFYSYEWENRAPERAFLDFAKIAREGGEESTNFAYVRSSIGRDTAGIYLHDLERPDQPGELYFALDGFDAQNILKKGTGDDDEPWDKVVGFTYESDRPRIYYVDEEEAALQKSIDAALPPGNLNRIVDRADEDKYIVIRSKGPREPGRYYLLKDRTSIEAIGHAAAVEPEQLGEKRAIWYTARDGRRIHAILTLPPFGEPPYPAVVNPHGGPSSRDGLFWNGAWWDEWPQLLATRGYAVLQPNFRGSTGYGTEHFRAGAGEWGLAMQDDMDDGMLHLVREGIADPERMAIFGWSYGGYAAMVGSLREPNIYRCSIPGAGVSNMDLIRKEEWRHRFSEVLQRSRGGVSPIELVDRVNVPVLLVHGDRDLIVDIKHSDLFAAELKKHGKPYRYVRLIDAAHTVDTLGYEHLMEFYPAMLDFLAGDCGFRTGSASR